MVASPPAKRQRTAASKDATVPAEVLHMWGATHQFSICGGLPPPEGYEPKQRRLEELLERLPGDGGCAVVFADKDDIAEVQSIVKRYCRTDIKVASQLTSFTDTKSNWKHTDTASNASTRVSTNCGDDDMSRSSFEPWSDSGGDSPNHDSTSETESSVSSGPPAVHVLLPNSQDSAALRDGACQYVINYSFPASGRKYIECFSKLLKSRVQPNVVFTMVDEEEITSRRCREVVGLLRRAMQAALKHEALAGVSKATELKSSLDQLRLNPEDDDADDDDDEEDEGDGGCQCAHCQSHSLASMTFHAPSASGTPRVEAVHIHINALDNLQAVAPLIRPRLCDHACTVICHHCFNEHAPWASYERFFALPEGMGSVRLVFVLAEDSSYHSYPDVGTFSGGSPWIDILDMASMDKADKLLENLIDHEIDLLKGRSDRIVLFGVSQGAVQSKLRFLRSRQELGGWIGGVGHVPTQPHVPRDRDPLTDPWRPCVNRNRPVRFLAGERDSTFPPAFVLRDVDRLRKVGGFTDVQVEVQPELDHAGWAEAMLAGRKGPSALKKMQKRMAVPTGEASLQEDCPDLVFLRKHLPAIVAGLASK